MDMDLRVVIAVWPTHEPVGTNWGDKLNPILLHKLTRLPVVHVRDVHRLGTHAVVRAIGSSVASMQARDVVWGTGFMSHADTLEMPESRFRAVRGPMTREKLLAQGHACPEVYGDPAVLYPLFYAAKMEKQYDVGIVQHYRERDVVAPPLLPPGMTSTSINVCGGLHEFIDKICECRLIVSSSLHGIIAAHAYGVPALWHRASDLPLGDGFKFQDYWASVGRPDVVPCAVSEDGVLDLASTEREPGERLFDADALIDAAPFIADDRKLWLKRRRRRMAREGAKGLIFARR